MKFAIIDTETNDLPKYKDASGKPVPADAPGQPRMAAFAMILLNDDLSIRDKFSALIKPDGWSMKPEAAAVNGLSDEILTKDGRPVREVLEVYSQAIREGYSIVAYGAQFDCKICRGELRIAGMPDLFNETKNICVMRKAVGVIPRPDGKKTWPKLEHCRAFLGLPTDGAHTAMSDAEAALAVFLYLRDAQVNLTPEVHFANQAPGKHGKSVETAQFLTGKPEPAPEGNVGDLDIPR